MKKSKYQQSFYSLIVFILVPYAFLFNYKEDIITIGTSTIHLKGNCMPQKLTANLKYYLLRYLV